MNALPCEAAESGFGHLDAAGETHPGALHHLQSRETHILYNHNLKGNDNKHFQKRILKHMDKCTNSGECKLMLRLKTDQNQNHNITSMLLRTFTM